MKSSESDGSTKVAASRAETYPLPAAMVGETVGTFLIVLLGTGAVATAVLTGALSGLLPVACVWGAAVTLAILCTAGLSGAHLNPAVSLALCLFRSPQFPRRRLPYYWAAQMIGAVLAALVIWAAFGPLLERFEGQEGLIRGGPGSERAAMIFGDYFPNPAMFGAGPDTAALMSPLLAAAVEALGTGVLVLVVFAVSDPVNRARFPAPVGPVVIGVTVTVLIAVFAPLTMAGWNPARDLGPRLVALAAGYGAVAFPGPLGGFWVYTVGPLFGAVVAGGLYQGMTAAARRPKSVCDPVGATSEKNPGRVRPGVPGRAAVTVLRVKDRDEVGRSFHG